MEVEDKYRVIYQDPNDLDGPVCVLVPSRRWMKSAMTEGVMPIDIPWRLQDEYNEAEDKKTFQHSEDLYNSQWTAKRTRPLTEKEAIMYLCLKDLPRDCWAKEHNRPMFKIVKKGQVWSDRTFRDAWEMNDER
jgi:hypothetical protein